MNRLLWIALVGLLFYGIAADSDHISVPLDFSSISTQESTTPELAVQAKLEQRQSPRQGSFTLVMEGMSMADTLHDGMQLTFMPANLESLERFEIVAVKYPNRGDTLFVKRLIGLPGDTIEIKDGILSINGEKYEEPYIAEYRSSSANAKNYGPYTVPDDSFFVMGDNRDNSNDSRWIGPLSSDLIIGVMVAE